MQDRFKYRAWDKENKKYIYGVEKGLEFYSTAGNLRVMTLAEIAESSKYIAEQCSGLKDKNGKLIYEGDIVEAYDYTIEHSQVVWDKGCYVLKSKDVAMYEHLSSYEKKCKIIGNIHENPELLEEDK
ncbi:YopX family protein [Ligilactobacillus sp. 110_WCHN]|uniref:YopX family protein n=1 Tax=Ligilactobacillus sp. 110_WCHN TaxID=3057125 RepID=UPI00267154F2|nr:YopX family protein [Ligilactobacillus sp. 110_WCHN]MDO3394089.1 YopX family protein [Ligilactobacillus sp. 110_WCHN]